MVDPRLFNERISLEALHKMFDIIVIRESMVVPVR